MFAYSFPQRECRRGERNEDIFYNIANRFCVFMIILSKSKKLSSLHIFCKVSVLFFILMNLACFSSYSQNKQKIDSLLLDNIVDVIDNWFICLGTVSAKEHNVKMAYEFRE